MFVVYDVIHRRKAALGYSLLVKTKLWTETEELISNLTHDDLIAAAKEIKETNRCTNPAILALERQVQTVAAHAPHSYARCFQFRLRLKALMITDGMATLWITISPADLRNPLVIRLAGVELDLGANIASVFARKTATMNPVAVAKFFHIICEGVLLSLFASGSRDGGLLGPVSTYFGTVETNGRGMLHLHCLVWLKGASHLPTLRAKIQGNEDFRVRLLAFLEHIIKCSANDDAPSDALHHACPDAREANTTEDFTAQLKEDSEAVAKKVQMHSPMHNPTCYKYNTSQSKVCRFDFPRPKVLASYIDHNGSIQLKRDNVWVNPWSPAIASLIWSNHDINFILSSLKTLALVHYITNYATKGDCSQYQRIMAAAIVRKAFEDRDKPGPGLPSYLPTLDKFLLKVFNKLLHNREVSGPLVAGFLLDLPDHYTPNAPIKSMNLFVLKIKFLLLISRQNFNTTNDVAHVNGSKVRPYFIFEHYQHRGLCFLQLSLYEYYRVVSVVKHWQKQKGDFEFDDTHAQRTHAQREIFPQQYSGKNKQLALVTLRGNLSDNKEAKDAIPGGHPETDACRANLAVILLSLFVLWERLLDLFHNEKAIIATYKEFALSVWEQCEPNLPLHIQIYAQNVCQMRKSRIEIRANAIARSEA